MKKLFFSAFLALALGACDTTGISSPVTNPEAAAPINGVDGANGINSLVKVIPILVGDLTNCSGLGGQQIDTWLDLNSNGLADDDNTATSYVCNGAGHNTLVEVIPFTGALDDCLNGGQQINSWLDLNDNGTYDTGDTNFNTSFVCNGLNGHNTLVEVTATAAPLGGCLNGGQKITTWLDLNDNGTPDDGNEVTDFVCNGLNGDSAYVNLIELDPCTDNNCYEAGGYRIESGTIDGTNPSILHPNPDSYVCNAVAADASKLLTSLTVDGTSYPATIDHVGNDSGNCSAIGTVTLALPLSTCVSVGGSVDIRHFAPFFTHSSVDPNPTQMWIKRHMNPDHWENVSSGVQAFDGYYNPWPIPFTDGYDFSYNGIYDCDDTTHTPALGGGACDPNGDFNRRYKICSLHGTCKEYWIQITQPTCP